MSFSIPAAQSPATTHQNHGRCVRPTRRGPCPGLAFFLLALLALTACAQRVPQAPYPHESIMTVIAELRIHLERDPYQRPPGLDLEGGNIYRVSLVRLRQLDRMTGEEYRDVLAFARAQCLERLGNWPEAAEAYEQAALGKSPLADLARERARMAALLAGLADKDSMSQTMDGYLNDLDVLERQLDKQLAKGLTWPYDSFVKIELERTQREKARLLFNNRLVRPGALRRALEQAARLVETHTESWRISEHRLMLGSFYETMARDWAAENPPQEQSFAVGEENWKSWANQAREAYRTVAQTDGDPVKPEGLARLRTLDAWSLRIESLAR